MANTENSCADLDIPDAHTQFKIPTAHQDAETGEHVYNGFKECTLGAIMDSQKQLQEETYFPKLPKHVSYSGFKFKDMDMRQLKDFLLTNEHALVDELHEMMDALGGIKDGIGSGAWKHWKKSHHSLEQMKVTDLSANDRQELLMEFVDALHFFMNIPNALQFTSAEVFNAYFSKHKENIDRQLKGY